MERKASSEEQHLELGEGGRIVLLERLSFFQVCVEIAEKTQPIMERMI